MCEKNKRDFKELSDDDIINVNDTFANNMEALDAVYDRYIK